MSAFAIKVYEFGEGDEFFVGSDEKLWEWLNASDVFLRLRAGEGDPFSSEGGAIRVLTPEGYVFYDAMLVPIDSDVALNPPQPNLCDFSYVLRDAPHDDMANILVLSPYRLVTLTSPEEFAKLNIPSDRIYELTI